MVTRRGFLMGLSAVGGGAAFGATRTEPAEASVARALSLSELVLRSRHAVIGTPRDAYCQWETIGKRRRIVTYSLVAVEQPLDGQPTETSEVLVRTLGGSIGDLGQIVHGEAPLALHQPAAVFLAELAPSVFRVTAMSQGHYPVRVESGVRRVRAGLASLELLGAEGGAVQRLHGRTVGEVEGMIAEEMRRAAR
jgi:hypothetical protein